LPQAQQALTVDIRYVCVVNEARKVYYAAYHVFRDLQCPRDCYVLHSQLRNTSCMLDVIALTTSTYDNTRLACCGRSEAPGT
jgi:hypothetical protein